MVTTLVQYTVFIHKKQAQPTFDLSSDNTGCILLLFFLFIYFLNLFIIITIFFWLLWVFVAVRGLSLVAASGGYSLLRCAGFSLRWLLLLRSTGSRAQAQ